VVKFKVQERGTRKGHIPEKFLMKQGQWCVPVAQSDVHCGDADAVGLGIVDQHEKCSSVE
jgi:hypothetical protein